VIGPNGSGKSNLLESLLFIFGHRASKMRLRHLKELIHNSANHYNIDKATVSVTFNEIEEVDPIEITQSEDGNSKIG
jgi:structural maintenance of chromosome 4